MTADAIVPQLPDGLHDAFLERLTVDYLTQTVTLGVNLCVGDPDASLEHTREAYQRADILMTGLVFCIVEPPSEQASSTRAEGLWIDAGSVASLKSAPVLPETPEGTFAWWIFVRDWNSFIYIAAAAVTLR